MQGTFAGLTVTITGTDNTGAYPMVQVQHATGRTEWVAADAIRTRLAGQNPTENSFRLVSIRLHGATSIYGAIAELDTIPGGYKFSEYTRNLVSAS